MTAQFAIRTRAPDARATSSSFSILGTLVKNFSDPCARHKGKLREESSALYGAMMKDEIGARFSGRRNFPSGRLRPADNSVTMRSSESPLLQFPARQRKDIAEAWEICARTNYIVSIERTKFPRCKSACKGAGIDESLALFPFVELSFIDRISHLLPDDSRKSMHETRRLITQLWDTWTRKRSRRAR